MPAPSAKCIFDTNGIAHAKIAETKSRREQDGMLTYGLVM